MTERHRLIKQPKLVYIPAIRHVPYQPARCIYSKTQIGWGPGTYEKKWVWSSNIKTESGFIESRWTQLDVYVGSSPIYKTVKICYPEVRGVKGRPAQVVKSASNSWNAGARSLVELPKQHFLNLKVKENPVAIVVGLSSKIRIDYNFDSLDHAVIFRGEGVRPLSKGVEGNLFPPASNLRIERTRGKIRFIAGDQAVNEIVDTKSELYCYVLLYALSDHVEYPVLSEIPLSSGESELLIESLIDPTPQGLSEFSIKTQAIASVNGVFASGGISLLEIKSSTHGTRKTIHSYGDAIASIGTDITGIGVFIADKNNLISPSLSTTINYATGSLLSRGMASSIDYLSGVGVFPTPSISGSISKPEITPLEAVGLFPVLTVEASTVLNGGVLTSAGTAYSIGKASSLSYLGGKSKEATFYDITGWFGMTPEGFVSAQEQLNLMGYMALDASVFFAFYDGVSIGEELSVYLILSVTMYEALSASDDFSFASILELFIQEGLSVSPKSSIARSEALQYAVNAITGAVSRYSNFGFKQFASSQGATYAITDNGLYELTGSTDEDSTIKAAIDFGASDFGTAQNKRISSVYAGIATDGEAYIRVIGDRGESHIYKAIQYGDEARAQTAKGISARHWRIGLELTDSTFAEIDNIEVEIAVSQRRLRGSKK